MTKKKSYGKKYKALVTGGTRGIGLAVARRLLSDGCDILITGTSHNPIIPKGMQYKKLILDNPSSLKKFIIYIKKEKIDIVINNAGINIISEFSKIKEKDFDRIMKINLNGPFLINQAVIPNMMKNNWGRVINVSSIFGTVSKQFRGSYSMSKFALNGMTLAMSAELSKYGILVNSISPGFIDTDLTRKINTPKEFRDLEKSVPIRRLGSTNEIAAFISWLVSSENSYVTGQNLIIDGGFTSV